jgi:hypothetical protein
LPYKIIVKNNLLLTLREWWQTLQLMLDVGDVGLDGPNN